MTERNMPRVLGAARILLLLALSAGGLLPALHAQSVPAMVNFQGRLTDASNNPLGGNHNFAFSIHSALTGGTQYWSETQNNVPVANGVFSVQLGASTPLNPDLFAASALYLEVSVDGVLLTPRERLVSSGYAFNADRLQGAGAASFVSTAAISQQVAGWKVFTGSVTLPAALTLTGQSADPAGVAGALYYNSATSKLRLHIGSGFVDVATGTTGGISAILSDAAQFSGDGSSAGSKLTLLASSVTLQGNSFNAANKLVQLNSSGDLQVGAQNASTVSASGHLTLANLAAAPAAAAGRIYYDAVENKLRLSTGAASSAWVDISTGGTGLSSIVSDVGQFGGDGSSSNKLTLLSSSVTLQGNVFNAPDKLVRLNSSGDLQVGDGEFGSTLAAAGYMGLANLSAFPAPGRGRIFFDPTGDGALRISLDGVSYVPISTGSAAGGIASVSANASQFSGDGTSGNALVLQSSSVTLQGNVFNAANRLVKLDGTGKLPVIDGSALTNITASLVTAAGVQAGELGAGVIASSVAAAKVGTLQIADAAVTNAKIAGMSSSKLSGALPALDGSLLSGVTVQASAVQPGTLGAQVIASSVAASKVGTIQLADSAITDAKVAAGAAIAQSKIASLTTDLGARLLKAGDTMSGDLQVGAQYASTMSAAGFLTLANLAAAPAAAVGRVYYDAATNKLRVSTGSVASAWVDLSTGGAGLSSIVSDAGQFAGDGSAGNKLTLLASSVTLQGNTFNAADKLVKLDSSGDLQVGAQYASTMSAAGFLTLANLAAAPAASVGRVYYDAATNKLRVSTGSVASAWVDLSTGGAGGLSAIISEAAQFSGDGSSAGNKLTLLSSSVTLQGNTFNAADKLVRLDSAGDLHVGAQYASTLAAAGYLTLANITSAPAVKGRVFFDPSGDGSLKVSLDGSSFVKLATGSAGSGLSAVSADVGQFSGDGTSGSKLALLSSSVTLQGNTFNAANKLVLLNSSGDLQVGAQYASTMSAAGFLTLANLAAAPAAAVGRVYYDAATNKLRVSTGSVASAWVDLSTGGAGLSSIVSDAGQFAGDGSAGNKLTLLSSSVTLQGNAFNGAGQLVKLDAGGALPGLVMNGPFTLTGTSTLTVSGKDAAGYSMFLSSGLHASSGTILAGLFIGNGAGLTNIQASSVAAAGVLSGALGAAVIASSVAVGAVGTLQIAASTVTSANLASDPAGLYKVTGGTMSVSNGFVGINTLSPGAALDVRQPAGSSFQVDVSCPNYVSLMIGGVEVARIKP